MEKKLFENIHFTRLVKALILSCSDCPLGCISLT